MRSGRQYLSVEDGTGVRMGETFLSYKSIFTDIRSAVDWVHNRVRYYRLARMIWFCLLWRWRLLFSLARGQGTMKKQILADLPKYVKKEPRLPNLLQRMRDTGAGAFLVTNSDYGYTNVRHPLLGQ